MGITLRQFQHFIAVAEHGNYRLAAEKLFVAQPALSVSIQKLEAEVGAQLLERGSKGVTLTPAGHALIKDARAALFYSEQACRSARLVALGEWGTLRLGFVGSATYTLLPLCVPAFRADHPNVKVELREDSSIGLINLVRNHEIDAAVVRGPIAQEDMIEAWVIQLDDLILAVPVDHPLAARKKVALEECRHEGFVLYASTLVPGLHGEAVSLCRKAGFTPCVSQEAIQVQTQLSLVASGMGIALVPAVTRSYSPQHVRFIDLIDEGARRCLSLSLVAHRDTRSLLVDRLRDKMLGLFTS
ncbi:LysR family transcriptional regulator [Pollutimonas nitritireducens]|uniref:LysR family transcriptional regulator n=1 Tax=Pollutimonas nitritireducens TaxID=2045209 RepID=A0A2N4UFH2_9BURK|nr:LysR family transcriptional regulator [Pollutimonas nitritireducens]PLC53745.1 LysR family transcriptional regulator [Pollutimonas nitritireducens]